MSRNSGLIHLLPLLILGIVAAVTVSLLLIYKGAIKNPVPALVKIPTEAQVQPKADYKNPLDAKSQYTNPFSDYKNPFDSLK